MIRSHLAAAYLASYYLTLSKTTERALSKLQHEKQFEAIYSPMPPPSTVPVPESFAAAAY